MCTLWCRHSRSNTWQVKQVKRAAVLGLVVRGHHTRCRTFMLDVPCSKGWLSVLAKERHGTCPSLHRVVWGSSARSSWEHRNCHSAYPSALGTTSSSLQPRSPFLLLCTASSPSHSHPPQTPCIPQLLLQPLSSTHASLSPRYGERTWAYLCSLGTYTSRATPRAGAPLAPSFYVPTATPADFSRAKKKKKTKQLGNKY